MIWIKYIPENNFQLAATALIYDPCFILLLRMTLISRQDPETIYMVLFYGCQEGQLPKIYTLQPVMVSELNY